MKNYDDPTGFKKDEYEFRKKIADWIMTAPLGVVQMIMTPAELLEEKYKYPFYNWDE